MTIDPRIPTIPRQSSWGVLEHVVAAREDELIDGYTAVEAFLRGGGGGVCLAGHRQRQTPLPSQHGTEAMGEDVGGETTVRSMEHPI